MEESGTPIPGAVPLPPPLRPLGPVITMAELAGIVTALASKLDDIQSDIYRRRDETPPRPRGPRRQSYTVGGPLVSDNTEEEDNAPPLATSATILHVQKAVPDGMIIKGISLAALRKLIEFKKLFAHQTNQERPLIDFLDPIAARLLVDEQRRGGTLAGRHLTYGNVLESTDQEVIQLFVEYIRVRQASNRNKFTLVVLNSVAHLKSKTENWIFGVRGYHLELHSAMTKLLWELGISLSHLYKGATNVETQFWPGMNYGPKEDYGVLKIVMTCLDRFAENFEQLIGYQKLKLMKSSKELITKLNEVNDRQADAAMTLENQDAASALPMSLRKLQEDSGYRRKKWKRWSRRENINPTAANLLLPLTEVSNATMDIDRIRREMIAAERNHSRTTGINRRRQIPIATD